MHGMPRRQRGELRVRRLFTSVDQWLEHMGDVVRRSLRVDTQQMDDQSDVKAKVVEEQGHIGGNASAVREGTDVVGHRLSKK